MHVCMCVCMHACVCVCVCVCERLVGIAYEMLVNDNDSRQGDQVCYHCVYDIVCSPRMPVAKYRLCVPVTE